MSKSKVKTNEQILIAYIKDAGFEGPMMEAIIRERLLKMVEITEQSMNEHPDKWNNGIIHPEVYRNWIKYTRNKVGFPATIAAAEQKMKERMK